MFEYIVQPGDSIYSIADMFDVSIRSILLANPGLSPNNIYPGLVIMIPVSNYIYQRYPWYIYFPYLFIRHPRVFWDDRRRWPGGWQGGGRPGGFPGGPGRPGGGFPGGGPGGPGRLGGGFPGGGPSGGRPGGGFPGGRPGGGPRRGR